MDTEEHVHKRRGRRKGGSQAMPSRLAFCMVAISLQLIGLTEAASRESIHTVVTTECTPYFDWQVLGLWYR